MLNDFAKTARWVCALAALAAGLPAFGLTVRLSELDLDLVEHMRSRIAPPPAPGLSAGGKPIRIGGKRYEDGFGLRGIGRLQLELDGAAKQLTAFVGVTDDSGEAGPVWFDILADGKAIYEGPPLRRGDPARSITLPLAGVRQLVLAVQSPDGLNTLSAWANARIDYAGAAPRLVRKPPEEPYLLTPAPPREPRIRGAAIFGARPGHPVLYSIAATGVRPMTFSATALPPELKLDAATGRLSGRIATPGRYRIELRATNALGSDARTLVLVIGDQLALTPPMGWNSWNSFASAVTAADVRAAADTFVRSGLIEHGWTYINIDDFWMTRPTPGDPLWADLKARAKALGYTPLRVPPADDPSLVGPARDEQGRINPNPRFQDMKGLVDYVHSLGLKIGLYSSPGRLTCGLCTGSFGHEFQDAQRFAEWGFDYLKYDWCSYRFQVSRRNGIPRDELMKPYLLMGEALRAQPRDIVYSLCQYGLGDVWEWGAQTGANAWRTTRDITDTWASMAGIGFNLHDKAPCAGPGHWNDPDMLVVGFVGWGGNRRATRLTPDEQYTHVALWSLAAAPLLIGGDLTKLDAFTMNLLTNDEVIAVNQDPLGQPARRVARQRNLEVWARPLADGAYAVGLFNRGELPADVTVRWSDLGVAGAWQVRDLWRQRDLGAHRDRFSAKVPRHGVVLVRLSAKDASGRVVAAGRE
jgi:alpha-galactosidase